MQAETNFNIDRNGQEQYLTDIISVRGKHGLRSEATEEIISQRPDLIIRWGITFFVAIFCLILIVCWIIKYPEIIRAPAKLTCINAPKPIVNLIGGKLIKLWVTEDDQVKAGQIIGYIESTANHPDVIGLPSHLDSIQHAIRAAKFEDIQHYITSKSTHLGELQTSYQAFLQSFLSLSDYLPNGFYLKKKEKLEQDLEILSALNQYLLEQKHLQIEDVKLSEKTFEANQKLNYAKVISEFEYRNEKSKVLNKQLTLPLINSAILQNKSQQNEKEREILELENAIRQQKLLFQQDLSTFKSLVDDWLKKYTLISPVDGKVAFSSFVQENQQLVANEQICFIYPEDSQYFAEVAISQSNFGKVALNQKVLLKFESYPFQEYGVVEGTISFISQIPVENKYLAKINLINNLQTNYGKNIRYRNGLLANAEIITQEMRLLERFYYNIVHNLNR